MKIYGKSTFSNDMFDKLNKGANGIEIHLNNEFIDENFDFYKEFDLNLI